MDRQLPLDHSGAPGQTCPENYQKNQIATADDAGTNCLVKGDRDGCRRGVSIFVKIDKKLFRLCAETLADSIDDPPIRLMRDDAFNARNVDFTSAQSLGRSGVHCLNSILEGFLAFHAQIVQTRSNRFGCGRATTAAARHEQEVGLLAIGAHYCGEKTMCMGTVLKHGSAGSVAKENTGVAVFPVYN